MSQPTTVAGKDLVGPLPLMDEVYREYDFDGRVYRINNPKALYYRIGGNTHRVVDNFGITHCVPAPGYMGCVLRWNALPEVTF
jgi:hypothetical protein